MTHNHNHSCSCSHTSVKYCSHCGVVYCEGCNQEWGKRYNQWFSYPYYGQLTGTALPANGISWIAQTSNSDLTDKLKTFMANAEKTQTHAHNHSTGS